MDSDDQWWTRDFEPEEFAGKVARFCKLIIRTRNRCDGIYRTALHGDWGIDSDDARLGGHCDGKSTGEATGAAWYHTTPPIDEHKWPCPVRNESGEHCEFTQKQLCHFLDVRQPKTLKEHARQGRFYIRKRKRGCYSIWFRSHEERAQFNKIRLIEQGTGT